MVKVGRAAGLVLLADDREQFCQPLAMMIRRAGYEVRMVPPRSLRAALQDEEVVAVITGLSRWPGGAAEALFDLGQAGSSAAMLLLSGAGDAAELQFAERLGPALGVVHTEALPLPVHAWQIQDFLERARASRATPKGGLGAWRSTGSPAP